MAKNKKLYSFVTVTFIVLIGFTAFLIYFAYNITKFTTFGVNTVVGSVYVGGLYGNEATDKVNSACDNWAKTAKVTLSYQDQVITLDNSKFVFNVSRSINGISSGRTTPLYVGVAANDPNYVQEIITQNEGSLKFDYFNYANIEKALENQIALLYTSININIGSYMDNYDTNIGVINSVDLSYNNAQFLSQRFNAIFNKIEIAPYAQFSLNDYIKTNNTSGINLTNEELSVIGTGIYQLILETNFVNIAKSISPTVPSYTTSGLEAYVDATHDLTFYNPNPYPYYVSATFTSKTMNDATQNLIEFQLSGAPFIDDITYTLNTVTLQPGNIYWYMSTYNGSPVTNVIPYSVGEVGYRTWVYRVITTPDNVSKKYLIFEDIYMPTPNIFITAPSTGK